jgi:hypothetical protein
MCLKRKERTDAKVALIAGSSIQGTHPSYLHGIVSGPIPFWSHIYDGDWFRLKISKGAIVSEDNMTKVKKAIADLPVPPEPEKKAQKKIAAPTAPVAVPLVTPLTAAVPKKPKRAAVKPAVPPVIPLMAALVEKPEEIDEENVVKIVVRKVEVDGRTVYLDSSTDKVYDMKCKYLGRLKEDSIVPFPDSDEET